MRTKKKAFLFGVLVLAAVVGLYFLLGNTLSGAQSVVRTVDLKQEAIDHQSFLENFDDAELNTEGTVTSFSGIKKMDADILNYVSETTGTNYDEPQIETSVKFFATYNTDTNMVTLSATILMPDGTEELDEIFGMAFTNSSGEIDAVMNIEGDSILLSELKQQGLIENCGWLSRLIKKVVAAVVAVVVIVAAPVVAAVVAVAATAVAVTEAVTPGINYAHNKKNAEPNGYINDQNVGVFNQWKFGLSTMNKNGCGVMAAYNLLRMRGQGKKLADVAFEIESKSGTLALGFFGTDPTHFGEYFRKKGIPATAYTNLTSLENAAKNMASNKSIILTAWNGSTFFDGAHVVAVEKSGSNFTIYNAFGDNNLHTYASLADYIYRGSLIIGYVVG